MKKILIACLNLLLVFNNVGFQAINATEVDSSSEETYEPGLPAEETDTLEDGETNESISTEENTNTSETSLPTEEPSTDTLNEDNIQNDNLDTNKDEEDHIELPAEEDDTIVNDSFDEETNEDTTLEINNSDEAEQISTVATDTVEFLDKENFRNNLPKNTTNLYFGTKSDYDLSKCTQTIDLGNNYTLYSYNDNNTYDEYVICEDGKQIVFPKNSSSLFAGFDFIQIIFNDINTSYVTNMSYMFSECYCLPTLDLSSFITSNVTDMSYMFYECRRLTTLDISNFDTSNVYDMNYMFNGCYNLTTLDLSNFNTSNVTHMNFMFNNCRRLTTLDLSNFDTSNVYDMSYMFSGFNNDLTTLDLSSFITSNVTDMSGMFSGCINLTTLDLSSFITSNVTDMSYMFYGCSNLTTLDISNFDTSNATDMSIMFSGCNNLTTLDLSSFNTSNVTHMTSMFNNCRCLTTLDLSSFNTSNVTDMNGMFIGCFKLNTIYATHYFKAPSNSESMFYNCDNLIGGQGTIYNNNETDSKYAHIDGGTDNPGYFTDKNSIPLKPILSVEDTYTYTGLEQTAVVTGFDDTTMNIEGNKATEAGDYTITVAPKKQWSDGTKDIVTIPWSIDKANPSYTLPVNLKATQGDTLSDITLPEGWKWNVPETQLTDVGLNTYKATFTPKDTDNYNLLTDIDITVEVEVAPIKPTLSVDEIYTYTGLEQTAVVTGFDDTTMNIEGNKATKAGDYTITVTPKTRWSDGTKEAVTVTWSIIKADPTYTLPAGLKVIQGDKLSDITLPSGWKWNTPETQLTDAGIKTYKATFTPEDTDNYNVLTDIDITVEVAPIKPTLSVDEIYTYTGLEQTVVVTGFDDTTMNIEGNKATKVGDYTITVTPKTQWSNGTKEAVTIEWSIVKANPSYTLPTDLKATQGDKLSDITLPEGWKWNTPETQLTDAGEKTYKATFTPEDTDNYNVLTDIDITVEVEGAPIKPTLSVDEIYTYTGLEQTAVVTGFDDTTMNIEGNKATEAGDYTITVAPKTQWSDGTKDIVTIPWSIDKANPSYTLPVNLKATQGDTLSDITLPEGWKWNVPETQLTDVGLNTYKATFTPEDIYNYNVLNDIDLEVTVEEIITYLEKDIFRVTVEDILKDASEANLYFGNIDNYNNLSSIEPYSTIGTNDYYSVYVDKNRSTYNVYVICKSGKKIHFPVDCTEYFAVLNNSNFRKIKNIEFKNIDAEHIENTTSMFKKLSLNSTLDLSSFNTKNATTLESMFEQFKGTTINFNGFNTSNVTSMKSMFEKAKLTGDLDLKPFDTHLVRNMDGMFEELNCNSLDLSSFNTECLDSASSMFCNATINSDLDISHFKTDGFSWGVYIGLYGLKLNGKLTLFNTDKQVGLSLHNISVEGDLVIPFKNVSSLDFQNAYINGNLDLKNIDVSNYTSMSLMFYESKITGELDISTWDTLSVQNMSSMFYYSDIGEINLSNFNTSNVTNMNSMFYGAKMNSLDLSNFNTSNVTNMRFMFGSCENLTELDLSNFDTSNVTDMGGMFSESTNLEIIDLSNFDTSRVTYMDSIFWDCESLKTVYASEKFVTNNIDDMNGNLFYNNTQLIGGLGTSYESMYQLNGNICQSKKYARLDTLEYKGYFTKKGYVIPDNIKFIDIDETTAHYEDIMWLAGMGISKGWDVGNNEKEFRPYIDVARCDMAAFIRRLAQKYNLLDANTWTPSESDWNTFIDIDKNSPHAEDVLWLAHAGISAGWDVGNGRKEFRPLVSVARCDMAAFIRRLAAKAELGDANTWEPYEFDWYKFVDIDKDSPHAEDVLWLAHAGISAGWESETIYGAKEFRPLSNVARCDMAAFLHRLSDLQ